MNNPTKTTAKDFFIYLALVVTMYISAISLINLLFDTINAAFPDPLAYTDFYSSSMRLAIAALIIVFPIFLIIARYANKEVVLMPEKRDLAVRRWMIYLTLFLSGAAVVTDLIVLVNVFLNGEITTRFILKVLALVIVAGGIFWYFISDVKRKAHEHSRVRWASWISIAVVVLSLVGGFFVIGSPSKQRNLRFDAQKVNDLAMIQNQIFYSYWPGEKKLPDTLDALKDPALNFNIPVDPQTDQQYEYSKVDADTFKLCATFNLPIPKSNGRPISIQSTPYFDPGNNSNDSWDHEAGKKCFDRTVNPNLLPTKPTGRD